jgi:hypothetical protein
MFGIHQGSLIRRWGDFVPNSTITNGGNQGLMGCLVGNTHIGSSFSQGWDTLYGQYQRYTTAATSNTQGGVINPTTNAGTAETNYSARLLARVRHNSSSNVRVYVGFTSNNNSGAGFTVTDTPLASGDSGLLVGYRSTDTNWMVFNNDGTGAMVATSLGVPKDVGWHLIVINWSAGATAFQVQLPMDMANPVSITSRYPATTTPLFLNCVGQTTANSAINWDQKGPFFEISDCTAFV